MAGEAASMLLRELLVTTKDGDWGRDEPADGFVPYRVIRGADFPAVRGGDGSTVPLRYLPAGTVERRTLRPGDILIETAGGGHNRPTGRTVYMTERLLSSFDAPATCASFARFLRVDEQRADPGFVFWYLQYLYEIGEIEQHQVQHTGIARFQYTKFADTTLIPLPPLAEQRAIAQHLGALDDKIELNRRMSETLEAMAHALFKSWFVDFDPVRAKAEGRATGLPKQVDGLFPCSFEDSDYGEIPTGWRWVPLPDAVEVNPPRALKRGAVAPYLDMANAPTRGHSVDEVVDREFGSGMRFVNGDTLVARITPCLENGKTAYVDFLKPEQVGWGSTEFIVLRPKAPLPAEYGYCLARSDEFRAFAIQSMTGSSGRQRVPAEALSNFVVAMPNAAIATAFGQVTGPLMLRAKACASENQQLGDCRDTLLPGLVCGELQVPS